MIDELLQEWLQIQQPFHSGVPFKTNSEIVEKLKRIWKEAVSNKA